jgi:hypothetical protein
MLKLFLCLLLILSLESNCQSLFDSKYEPVEGKIIGIWPHNDRFQSTKKLNELKTRWGFNYILLAEIYSEKELLLLKNSGYDSLHVMYQVILENNMESFNVLKNKLFNLGKLWAYYFDEPLSKEQPFIQILGLFSELSNNTFYPHANFIVSEVDEYKAQKFLRVADKITYSGYGNSDKFGVDQIQTWHEWKNYLGNTFSMLWISANEDSDEYKILLKAAKELNINSIWLYALEPIETGKEVNDSNYKNFCDAAVEFGFMKAKSN